MSTTKDVKNALSDEVSEDTPISMMAPLADNLFSSIEDLDGEGFASLFFLLLDNGACALYIDDVQIEVRSPLPDTIGTVRLVFTLGDYTDTVTEELNQSYDVSLAVKLIVMFAATMRRYIKWLRALMEKEMAEEAERNG